MNAKLLVGLLAGVVAVVASGGADVGAGPQPEEGGSAGAPAAPPQLAGCPMLPADNIWNTPVDTLPLDRNSEAYVTTIGAGTRMHADFGSGLWNGGRIGIPFVLVPGDQPRVPVSFWWPDQSEPGPYPIPTDAPIEGPPGAEGDRHVLAVDRDACVLYELYHVTWQDDGSIEAGSGAVFDLRSNALRPETWTSADAAGLPILPGLVRYDEVATGEIGHAVRFTVPETRRAYVWPGRHFASSLVAERYPPMGQRFRLKASVPLDGFSPEVRVILQALKTYGMILADNGSPWFVSGVPDERWNNDHLRELGRLHGSDFEAVDVSSLMVDPDSGQARGAAVPTTAPTAEPTREPPPEPTLSPTDAPTAPPADTPTDPAPTAEATREPTRPGPRWPVFVPRADRAG